MKLALCNHVLFVFINISIFATLLCYIYWPQIQLYSDGKRGPGQGEVRAYGGGGGHSDGKRGPGS